MSAACRRCDEEILKLMALPLPGSGDVMARILLKERDRRHIQGKRKASPYVADDNFYTFLKPNIRWQYREKYGRTILRATYLRITRYC
jgi:hypothetical protein